MDTPSTPSSLDPVGRLLDEFLSGGELGDEAFERFVARHPAHADALRGLHAAWAGVLAALPAEGDEGEPWGGVVPEAGTMLGGFRLVRLLGEGGMSRVWEAEQIALGRRVALKLVRPGLEPGGLHRLWREARAAGRINHRGIVPVFEVGEIEGQPFIVEQLVGDGTTLGDLIARGRAGKRPDPRDAATRFVEIAEVLHAAHEGGILHGDIKPQNILIDRDRRPRVSDFGLSQMRGEGEAADHLRGTVAYMSPEQALGTGRLDARSDVFSLGAVLYEALTLERALPGSTTGEVLERHRGPWPPPAPHRLNRRVSADLSAVCLRALARDPAARYATLAELAEDLGRVLRHEPTVARPVGPALRSAKWARRNPGKAVAIGMTGVLVAALGAMLVRESRLRQLAERQAREARLRGYVSSLLAAQIRLEQGQPVEARRRLDDCAADLRDWEWGLLSREAGSSVLVLGGHPPGPVSVAVSAAGDRVVTAAADGLLRAFDGASGAPLGTLRAANQALGPVALAADGRTVACGTLDGRVVLADLQRGATLAAIGGHTGAVTAVALSGDGRRVVSASLDEPVRSWDAQAGTESVVLPFLSSNIVAIAASRDASVLVSSSKYGFVSAWSGADGALINELNGYERGPSVVAVDAAGARVAAGVTDGHVRAWQAESGELLFETLAGSSAIVSVTLSGDGTRLAAAPAGEGPVLVWEVDGGELLETHAGHRGRVTSLAATGTGERIVAGCEDGSAYVWDDQQVAPLPMRWDSAEFVGRSLAASGDGTTVATCATADRHLRVWRHGQELRVQPAPSFAHCAALDSTGALLVAGLGDGSLVSWSLPGPGVERVLPLGAGPIEALALASDGRRAVAAAGHELLLVDLASGKPARWSGHGGSITSIVASADLARVASASTDGTVRLWDGATGSSRVLLDDGPFVDHVLAIDPAGRWLACSPSDGGLLHVYSLQPEPAEHTRAVTPRGGVPCLAFLADGRRLASSSTTSPRISLWEVSSGERLIDLTVEEAGFYGLAGGGPGRLVGLTGDGSLRVWDAESQ